MAAQPFYFLLQYKIEGRITTLHKGVTRVALQAGERFEVACIGEFVEVHHRLIAAGDPVEHEVAADEAGAASHKNGHFLKTVEQATAVPSMGDRTTSNNCWSAR